MVVNDMLKGKLTATSASLSGVLSPASASLKGNLSAGYILQDKVVEPSSSEQTITPDVGFGGLASVKVSAIPNNYGLITWNGSTLTVS